MSDVTCTSCNIETVEEVPTAVVYYAITGIELTKDELETLSKDHPVSTWQDGSHGDYTVMTVDRPVSYETSKVFDGTVEQAQEAGWQENEFGFVCPSCAGDDFTTEDGSAAGAGTDELLDAIVAVRKRQVSLAEGILETARDDEGFLPEVVVGGVLAVSEPDRKAVRDSIFSQLQTKQAIARAAVLGHSETKPSAEDWPAWNEQLIALEGYREGIKDDLETIKAELEDL